MHKFHNEDGAVYIDIKEIVAIQSIESEEPRLASRIHLRGGSTVLVSEKTNAIHSLLVDSLELVGGASAN